MPEHPGYRLADALADVCDAVYDIVAEEDYGRAARRLERALGRLEQKDGRTVSVDENVVASALRAVKHLGRALEAAATGDIGRAEAEATSAAGALRNAIRKLRVTESPVESKPSVQLSVNEALSVPNEEAVQTALENLLHRSESGAFVMFVDSHTGNIIQFLGSKERELVLDLPTADLSEEERQRAAKLFAAEGIHHAEEDDARYQAGAEDAFSVNLGRDPKWAAALALRIFTEVYGSPSDFTLKIEGN